MIKKKKSGVSDLFNRLPRAFKDDSFAIISEGMTNAALEAKASHRFVSRSGNLERSIIPEVKQTRNNIIGRVYLKDSIANYGKYIHNGFRSWKPDPFLEKAFETESEKIISKLTSNLEKLLQS